MNLVSVFYSTKFEFMLKYYNEGNLKIITYYNYYKNHYYDYYYNYYLESNKEKLMANCLSCKQRGRFYDFRHISR